MGDPGLVARPAREQRLGRLWVGTLCRDKIGTRGPGHSIPGTVMNDDALRRVYDSLKHRAEEIQTEIPPRAAA